MTDALQMHWPKFCDPVSQAHLWVPHELYPWQKNVLRRCMTQGSRVAVVTPNESGKTSTVIPALGLSWMANFPGSLVVSTAGVERQIKSGLWPVLRGALAKYPAWTITDDLHVKAPSVNGLPPSEWEAFTTRDPHYAEGFHSRTYEDKDGRLVYAPLLIIIDEAKTLDDPELMFAFLKRCSPDALLMISTPGQDSGDFHDAFHAHRGDPWDCVEVTWQDCPHLRTGFKLAEREQMIREKGEDHPLVASWVFGRFYRAGAKYVFDRITDVDWAMGGMVPHIRGERRGALEFSAGGDEQVFGMRDGNHMTLLETWHERDTIKLAKLWVEKFKKLGLTPDQICGDEGGLGHVVMDYLQNNGYPIRRYSFDASPRNPHYYDSRAVEDYYELKYFLQLRSIGLPNDEKLKEQFRKRQFIMGDDNVLKLEPKKKGRDRGEGSPDRLDMTVMLFADMPRMTFDSAEATKHKVSLCGTLEEAMAANAAQGNSSMWEDMQE